MGLREILLIVIILALPVSAIFNMGKDYRSGRADFNPLWVLVILFFPIFGSLIYFQIGRHSMRAGRRKFAPQFHSRKEE